MKNVYTFFKKISLRAWVQNFKVQEHLLQKLSSWNEVTHSNFYKTYTAKTLLTFLRRMFVRNVTKT